MERKEEELTEARDQAIRIAYRRGMTMRDIGREVDLTHQRVSQILRKS